MAILSKKYLNDFSIRENFSESVFIRDNNRIDKKDSQYDVFLSYCYSDKEYAIKIVNMFEKIGYKVYIDLRDPKLDRKKVDIDTVARISNVMDRCKSLVYVHTKSATVSKWCPWELGYMSGKKNFRCATILLIEDEEDFPRQEYLEIYPYLTYSPEKKTNEYDFWVHELDSQRYVKFSEFLNGKNPFLHK